MRPVGRAMPSRAAARSSSSSRPVARARAGAAYIGDRRERRLQVVRGDGANWSSSRFERSSSRVRSATSRGSLERVGHRVEGAREVADLVLAVGGTRTDRSPSASRAAAPARRSRPGARSSGAGKARAAARSEQRHAAPCRRPIARRASASRRGARGSRATARSLGEELARSSRADRVDPLAAGAVRRSRSRRRRAAVAASARSGIAQRFT